MQLASRNSAVPRPQLSSAAWRPEYASAVTRVTLPGLVGEIAFTNHDPRLGEPLRAAGWSAVGDLVNGEPAADARQGADARDEDGHE